jgi:hypothetical protein
MNNNLKEGIDFYFNESGLMVFTKEYHLKRGFCCGNGCINCPYHYENVADEKKRELLQKNCDSKEN